MPFHPASPFALIALLLATPAAAQAPAACKGTAVTLVLSGGGAKGLAHVGVIEELQRAQVPIKMVVGSSMGALIGALYAGYTSGGEIAAMIKRDPLRRLFLPTSPSSPAAWGGLVPLLRWEDGERGFSLQGGDQRIAANGILNATFLSANLSAAGNFDQLGVPLRVVATDLHTRAPVVLKSGDIAQAVRASISVPLLFPPEVIGSQALIDGGLSANIPIAVARAEGASLLVVSDVTAYPDSTQSFDSPVQVASRLLDWLFLQRADSLGPQDLRIRPAVDQIDPTDYSPAMIDSLIGLGRTAAKAMLSKWECLPVPDYGSDIGGILYLPRSVAAINSGMSDASALREVVSALKLVPNSRVDIPNTSLRLMALAESDRFREVWLVPSPGQNQVNLNPVIRRLPRRSAGVGIAYDGELGGRVWGGFLDRRVPILHSEIAGVLALGRYRSALDLAMRRATLFGNAGLSPVASLQLLSEEQRNFTDQGDELSSDRVRQALGRLGFERYFGRNIRLSLGGELRTTEEQSPVTGLLQTRNGSAIFATLIKRAADGTAVGTLNVVAGPSYRLATFGAVIRGVVAGVRLEQQLRLGIGDSLPASLTMPLGGSTGFPGLHQGALLGDREYFTSLTLSRRLVGPLQWRVTGAVGRSSEYAVPNVFLPLVGQELPAHRGNWLAGARVGVGAATPIGPLQVEYGRTSQGRDAVLLRVGRWF